MKQAKPKERTDGLVFRQIDDERLVHDLTTGETFCLDPTAARVLALCDGATPVSKLLLRVQQDMPETGMTDDTLWVTLEQLRRHRLLEPESLGPTKFDGMSRRAMLKKTAAVAAAVPIVYIVTAEPLLAQSGGIFCGCGGTGGSHSFDNACPCTSNLDCCSGICSGAPGVMTCAATPNANINADLCCSNFTCDCATRSGVSARLNGCTCVSNLDCCSGICSGAPGVMTCAATPNVNPVAAPCCP